MSRKIILSTRNPAKVEQIKAVFKDSPFSILSLTEAGIEGEGVEDGNTLQENALKKALFVYESSNSKIWITADDTGIFIDALNGLPGIKSSRWAGENAKTEEITQYTLNKLKDVKDRSATFETAVALISPKGERFFFSGKVRGKVLEAPRCQPQPKMPYSPIFMPDGFNKVWAEMSAEEENQISHRGKAFKQVRDFLEENYGKEN